MKQTCFTVELITVKMNNITNFVIKKAVCWPYVNNTFVDLTVNFVNRNEGFGSVWVSGSLILGLPRI